MQPGLSTACFYPLSTEESLACLLELKPACVEVFLNAAAELEPAYLRELRAMADAAGTKILSVHPYLSGMEPVLFFSEYQRRFDEGREIYHRFYEAANLLGAGTLVFHGDSKNRQGSYARYFERFSIIWEDARAAGVSLCQENVERCPSRETDFFAAMRQALPQVEYVLDVKQAVRSAQDISKLASVMGGRIKHVHLSDHNYTEPCLPPGRRVFNIKEFLTDIKKTGFSGGVIVELYRENFEDIVELSASFQHLLGILSTDA